MRLSEVGGTESLPGSGAIGAYWTRTNSTEVDIVVTDDSPVASSVLAIGSIKWREAKPFNVKDLRRLQAQRQEVTGSQPDTPPLTARSLNSAASHCYLVRIWRS